MNEKELNEQRTQDKGLKAAMARRRSQRPQMPKGLNERVMQKAAATSSRSRRWWWAAAACLLIIIGIGVSYQFSDSPRTISQKSTDNYDKVHVQSVNRPRPISQSGAANQSIGCSQSQPISQSGAVNHSIGCSQSVNRVQPITQSDVAKEEQIIEIQVPRDEVEPKVVYASTTIYKDTVVKAPARMEEFVEKMAEFCKAETVDLDCMKSKNDSIVSRIYVIEDSPEKEVFERLIQMAVWYDNDAPGYFLTFSGQQFLFQLHDLEQNLKYFVMAERINAGRILLYSTHIPLGSQFSMACYLNYRNKLNEGKLKIDN